MVDFANQALAPYTPYTPYNAKYKHGDVYAELGSVHISGIVI